MKNTQSPRRTPRLISVTFLAASTLGASLAHGQSVEADNDTFVNKGSADTNYGTNSTFQVRNDGGSRAQSKTKDILGYVSFDLSTFSESSFASTSMQFEYVSGGFSYAFDVYGIPDLGPDEFFDETELTLNNAAHTYKGPVNAGDEGSLVTTDLEFLGSFDVAPLVDTYGTVSFSSTELTDFLNADTNDRATFILFATYETGGSAAQFASSEHATLNGPLLTAVPEPSAYALIAGSLVLLGACLRRRR